MPTNLYGPGDNYHPENSHVMPALIRRFHEAKLSGAPSVTIWGTGTPRREFLHVDDMAAASVFVMNLPKATYDQQTRPMQSHLNVGSGRTSPSPSSPKPWPTVVGYPGRIVFDATKPDGTPRKLHGQHPPERPGLAGHRSGSKPAWRWPTRTFCNRQATSPCNQSQTATNTIAFRHDPTPPKSH